MLRVIEIEVEVEVEIRNPMIPLVCHLVELHLVFLLVAVIIIRKQVLKKIRGIK
jgi:hypothetical protein